MAKRKRRKKKNKKKILILLLIIILFLFGTFLFDKKTFYNLKDSIVMEINKITNKIEKQISKYKPVKFEDVDIEGNLKVYFLDVGQAESILIKYNDEYTLIDAGNNNDGEKLVKYFKYLDIEKFKYVFVTHPHEDHIGGMDNIIKNFKIENFYMSNNSTTTETYLEVLSALEKKKIKLTIPKIDDKMKLGDSEISVLSLKNNYSELNDSSIVLKLVYNNISFLFTGDITTNVEKELLNKDIKSTILKVAHHGSKYSNSAAFLRKVNPKYAIISCGENNDYSHPHKIVLDKLNKLNTEIYRTDTHGTIVAISNGDSVSFKSIKTYTDGG